MRKSPLQTMAIGLVLMLTATPALAAQCGNSAAGFARWLATFKREAAAMGISQRAIDASLNGVTYDRGVIELDRNQKSFKLSFKRFYKLRVNNAMINRGRRLIRKHDRLFSSIESRYGVPPEIIAAIWGLETHYGTYKGKPRPIMRSLATLAYDCRRSAFFTNELLSALEIVHRGYMSPSRMRGAWAGEIGQTQFMPSSYVRYAVDYDGDGRRDLVNSIPDVLASTANFLKHKGWQRGAGWGPGTTNSAVLREWNRAEVYRKTIGVMAQKMGG